MLTEYEPIVDKIDNFNNKVKQLSSLKITSNLDADNKIIQNCQDMVKNIGDQLEYSLTNLVTINNKDSALNNNENYSQ